MKALVISGGGSKGAFAGGIAEYLIRDCCTSYELFVGCSTGSLLMPHLALGKIDKIKSIYTSVRQKDIFSLCPFIVKKTKNGIETRINHFNMILTFLKGCPTFGESNNLRKLIKKSISPEELEALKEQNKKVIFTVSNITDNNMEYIHTDECNYNDFCDWVWASCNYTPFMSLLSKNGCQYADGGFGDLNPILCAIENGACEIDVIILEEENRVRNNQIIKNQFSLLFRILRFMTIQNGSKDLIIGKLAGVSRKIDINFYYTPRHLTENPLFFNSEQMTKWWQEGYEFAKSKNPVRYCHIPEQKIK
ncbi:patatin [Flavobacterium sp. ALD4]|uniref:patatin-like phospholipase family protein n=1 Tax=Flavobacterium sp. ALD4 TaxID=2058314 RepID=UPI000C340E3F|nr:patatin-like phospholipase family protein [Flavobacterium sp. ALD4]PKH68997.1 patatin [Flavobacterium sp. ALD4]